MDSYWVFASVCRERSVLCHTLLTLDIPAIMLFFFYTVFTKMHVHIMIMKPNKISFSLLQETDCSYLKNKLINRK